MQVRMKDFVVGSKHGVVSGCDSRTFVAQEKWGGAALDRLELDGRRRVTWSKAFPSSVRGVRTLLHKILQVLEAMGGIMQGSSMNQGHMGCVCIQLCLGAVISLQLIPIVGARPWVVTNVNMRYLHFQVGSRGRGLKIDSTCLPASQINIFRPYRVKVRWLAWIIVLGPCNWAHSI